MRKRIIKDEEEYRVNPSVPTADGRRWNKEYIIENDYIEHVKSKGYESSCNAGAVWSKLYEKSKTRKEIPYGLPKREVSKVEVVKKNDLIAVYLPFEDSYFYFYSYVKEERRSFELVAGKLIQKILISEHKLDRNISSGRDVTDARKWTEIWILDASKPVKIKESYEWRDDAKGINPDPVTGEYPETSGRSEWMYIIKNKRMRIEPLYSE